MMMDYDSGGWDVEIIPYAPQLRTYWVHITCEWFLEYHLPVEPFDQQLFEDPVRHVIAPGGAIFFARCCNEIVGTCGVMKHTAHKWELIKLGVKRPFRGMHIGQRLVEAALEHAKSAGAQRIVLYTNSRLLAAYFLYRKLGFIKHPFPDGGPARYAKANTFMILELPSP
jgi:ribosomal protein S18 acetylase RimI-like enzyme